MKIPNNAHVTFRLEHIRCGRKKCKVCRGRKAVGHGPYWYAYATVKGKFGKAYVGKDRAAWELARAASAPAVKAAEPKATDDQRAMLLRGATPKLAARVLGVKAGAPFAAVRAAFKEAIKKAHPDVGGSTAAAAAVNAAFALLRKIIQNP